MNNAIIIEAKRTCYSVGDATNRSTITAGELIRLLQDYDENTPVITSHDGGYTYGEIRERDITDFSWKNEDY